MATGGIITRTGEFTLALPAASAAYLAGAASFGLFVRAPNEKRQTHSIRRMA